MIFYNTLICECVIGLSKGQKIFDRFSVHSKIGSGILYLLDTGISFEVLGKGLVLEITYAETLLVKEIKKETLLVSWDEGKDTFDVRLRTKNPSLVAKKVTEYQGLAS
jgi:hypothetical protein